MLVKQEQLNPCEVELHIEIEAEKVGSAIDRAYIELGKSVNIPGFRKGKAPKAILQQFLGEDMVKERAADSLLQAAYLEALEESGLDPYAPADVDVTKYEVGEPLTFTAKVPLAPKTELGEYKGLKVERKVVAVGDEDVDREIDQIRRRHAKFPEVSDRPAQVGDVVRIETKAANEPDEEPKGNVAKIGENLPDFDNGLTGMNVGEVKVVDVTYPDDFATEELQGKTVPVQIDLKEIREEVLPEVTDEWVKETFAADQPEGTAPEDIVDTADKLRARIREAMVKASEEAADAQVQNELVGRIVEGSEVCFPQVLLDEGINEHLEELLEGLKKRNLTLEDYLKYKGVTSDELRGDYEERARQELKTRLVLREIVDKESIAVEEEDIEAELMSMAEGNHVPVETIRAYVEKTDNMASVRNRILTKKVMDFLLQSSNIKNVG